MLKTHLYNRELMERTCAPFMQFRPLSLPKKSEENIMKMKALLLITALFLTTATVWAQGSFTQGASKNYKIKMNVGAEPGATYQWSVTPATGTSTNLAAVTGNEVTIVWDGPVGSYTLEVQVTDGNGCLGEPISQTVEILAPGNLIFAADYPNTIICSDLAGGNEGSVPAHSVSSFRITYAGAVNLQSANITIQNPAGDYVGLDGLVLANQGAPEITLPNAQADKEIIFDVVDAWENTTSTNTAFTVKLVSARTTDNSDITADSGSDVTRTVTVLPKPAIAFE